MNTRVVLTKLLAAAQKRRKQQWVLFWQEAIRIFDETLRLTGHSLKQEDVAFLISRHH